MIPDPPRRRGRWWRWCGLVAGVLAVGLVGWGAWRARPERSSFYTDGGELRVAREIARLRDVLWSDPVALPAPINSEKDDYEPAAANDGNTLFFVRGRPGENADIWVAHREGNSWSDAHPLVGVNSAADELGPQPGRDGLSLYFYSDRPGGCGGFDIWVSRRGKRSEAFGEPVNLGPEVNSPWDEYGPAPAPDGTSLDFASNRPRDQAERAPAAGWSATLRAEHERRAFDLYTVTLTASGPRDVRPLAGLNTPFDEGSPAWSPVGDFLYFSSNRPGGAGGYDLYCARRTRDGLGACEPLGDGVNTASDELDPTLGMGGFALYFSSNRSRAGSGGAPSNSTYDVYLATSREVYADVEVVRAGVDWDAFWAVVGPGLLGLLLLLALLLLGRLLPEVMARRRLSLLARCLLASLFAHGLLLALFTVWQVSTSLKGVLNRRGAVRVALGSAAQGASLAAQVRGGFAEAVRLSEPVAAAPRATTAWAPAKPVEPPAVTTGSFTGPRAMVAAEPRVPALLPEAAHMRRVPSGDARAQSALARIALPTERVQRISAEEAEAPELAADDDQPAPRAALASTQTAMPAAIGPTLPRIALGKSDFDNTDATVEAIPDVQVNVHRAPALPESLAGSDPLPAMPTVAARAPRVDAAETAESADFEPRAGVAGALRGPVRGVQPAEGERLAAPARVRAFLQYEDRGDVLIAAELAGEQVPVAAADKYAPPIARLADVPLPEPSRRRLASESAEVAVDDARGEGLAPALPAPGIEAGRRWDLAVVGSPAGVVASALTIAPEAPAMIDPGGAVPMSAIAPRALWADLEDASARASALPIPGDLHTDSVGGTVFDAHTGAPLAGARVRLDLADGASVSADTTAEGVYTLTVPPVPEFFAISASADGYLPASANVAAEAVRGGRLMVNFRLRRADVNAVAVEAEPDVHHLGDDQFSGVVNSQFQKQSEGATYSAAFELAAEQVAPYMRRAELTMLTRGVQLRHVLVLNGTRLPARLDYSPADGSFGTFRTELDVALLHAGANTLEIHALRRGSDVDDFEFVNVQIHLYP